MTLEAREAIRKVDAALDFVESFVAEIKGDPDRTAVYTRTVEARAAQPHEEPALYP
jgi:hypothetical protein